MKKTALILSCIIAILVPSLAKDTPTGIVSNHGALSVKQNTIVNSHGQVASLAGPSFFWSNTGWGQEKFYHQDVVKYFATKWHAGIVRAAIGADHNGGLEEDYDENLARAKTIIDAAIKQDIYVIVDFHSHHAEDKVALAKRFLAT